MKKLSVFLAAVLLLMQAAGCAVQDREAAPAPSVVQRTETVVAQDIDPQENYPMENPGAQEELTVPELTEKPATPVSTAPSVKEEEPAPSVSEKEEKAEQQVPAQPEKEPQTESKEPEKTETPKEPDIPVSTVKNTLGEMRAVWISYFEYGSLLTGQSESSFTANVGAAFDTVKQAGLNTVIVQVRPYSDALYNSQYFPWSYLAAGTEGQNPGFDPLKIMVREAHKRGLEIEAWINPYRVRSSGYKQALSEENPAKAMVRSGDAIEWNGGIYYDPASKKAQELIVNGVQEIVANYDVDGIHFDDYFYPTTDAAFDADSYQQYKNSGGKLALADWRRENVNQLIKQVYAAVKQEDSSVRFGVSPQGNLSNNYNQQFIDVELWLSTGGYVDYICPQIYFGFNNGSCPYAETVAQWNNLIRVSGIDLYVGLSPFKLGQEDTWAGSGKNEWKNTTDILQRMVETAREEEKYQGFVLFRYDSLFQPAGSVKEQVAVELKNLKDILK